MNSYLIKQFFFSAFLQDKLDSSTDLIELNASTSFEIDDFDPLNQNAKQLPIVQSKGGPSIVLSQISSNAHTGVQAFSNPVYPFHMPNQLPPKPQSSVAIASSTSNATTVANNTTTNNKIDDELELLRKYGLDRFKIVDTNRSNQCNGTATANDIKFNHISNNNHHSANDSMFQNSQRTWTTFD